MLAYATCLKWALVVFYFTVRKASGQENTALACDGARLTVNGTSGTITSPNYPAVYPDRTICQWVITTAVGTRIAIKFAEIFGIEPSRRSRCYDSLFLEEPGKILEICGLITYNSFVTNGNSLNVSFVTDHSISMMGFSFNWSAVDAGDIPPPTIINLTATYGVISSPNYPKPYPPFADFVWIIKNGTSGKFKRLEFDSLFDLEGVSGDECPYDSLTMEDFDQTFNLKYCKRVTHLLQLARSSDITVRFKSDQTVQRAGFSFRFSEIDPPACESETKQTGSFGVVSTPFFPLPYETGLDCTWFITSQQDTLIAVRFDTRFEIEATSECLLNFMQVFDGPSTDAVQYQKNFCGGYPPRNFLTTSNSLTVRFVSASLSSNLYVGFSLNWTSEEKCADGEFSCWDGSCISGSLTCNGDTDCPMDIADEAICFQEDSNQCGIPEISPVFYWDARIIGGHEVQKGSWPWQGYLQVNSQGNWIFLCGAALIFEEWAITAAHCIVAKGLVSRVVFGDHSLADSDQGIEQAYLVDDMFIPAEYRSELQNPWLYGFDIALLHFASTVNFTKYIKPVCLPTSPPVAGEIVVITGWGTMSRQTSFLADTLRQVQVPIVSREVCNKGQGFHVPDSVFCAGRDTEGANSCKGDSGSPAMRLTNGTWQVSGIASFGIQCGLSVPSAYADVYELLPVINSMIEAYNQGKEIHSVVIKDQPNGAITSPNYGSGKYPQNLHLRWHIIGPATTVIAVRFDAEFSINGSRFGQSPCNGDFIWMYDGASTDVIKYGTKKLCGTTAPLDFESTSNSIIVEFQSDLSFESTGFKLTWTVVDACETDQFRCWNTTCIPRTQKCDGSSDCVNEEDEIQCARGEPMSTECGKAVVAPDIPWNPLIVGGHNAPEGAWPWQVALYVEVGGNWFFACGGTLIDVDRVLTAAHCIAPNRYQVSVGDYDLSTTTLHERRINVSYTVVHPAYTSGHYDIAVLILSESVDFKSQWTKPVCLPQRNDPDPAANTTCMIVGWGQTGIVDTAGVSNIMQQSHLRVLNDSQCDAIFFGFETLQRHFICAGHEHERANTCYGDSGGGLFCLVKGFWVQYGIVSFGTICGKRTYYERISLHHDFLESVQNVQLCDGLEVREGTSGSIIPPTILGGYRSNINCSWLLRGPLNTVLVIQFDFFSVESCNSSIFDFLNVYDGNSSSARQFLDETFCRTIPKIRGFESSTNEVLVTFFLDTSVEYTGFRITWMAVESCESEYFRCWDGSCIEYLTCDGNMDCSDQSDEAECPHAGSDECGRQEIKPEFLSPTRIVGGNFVKNGSWPFQVYFRTPYNYFCAGTIVKPLWILTSAECIDFALGFRSFSVVVGEIDATKQPEESNVFSVEETFIPPEYNNNNSFNIGLLRLDRNIKFSPFVQPACLALENDIDGPKMGHMCVLLGWGRTNGGGIQSSILRQSIVPILNQDVCVKVVDHFDSEKMFCAANLENGGVGACQSDYGGPVICLRDSSWLQFGIITGEYGCGAPGVPDLYTKVAYYTQWIEQTINSSLPSPSESTSTIVSSAAPSDQSTYFTEAGTKTNSIQYTVSETTFGMGYSRRIPTGTDPKASTRSYFETATTSRDLRLRANISFIIILFRLTACSF